MLLLLKQDSERQEINEQQIIYANLELPYKPLKRAGTTSEIPQLTLDSTITHVRMMVYLPRSAIDSLSYILKLLLPSRIDSLLPDLYFPGRFDSSMDTIRVTLTKGQVSEVPGSYTLVVKEKLSSSLSQLTPESYIYPFRVVY